MIEEGRCIVYISIQWCVGGKIHNGKEQKQLTRFNHELINKCYEQTNVTPPW